MAKGSSSKRFRNDASKKPTSKGRKGNVASSSTVEADFEALAAENPHFYFPPATFDTRFFVDHDAYNNFQNIFKSAHMIKPHLFKFDNFIPCDLPRLVNAQGWSRAVNMSRSYSAVLMENTVFFLAELGLLQYPTAVLYSLSMIAASAIYAARCTLNRKPFWTETLKHHTGYTEDVLIDCAKLLAGFHSAAVESKLKAVYKKCSSADREVVALLTPAKNLMP